ncbi:putative membrane protein [Actinoalloteichus sp. GBA129-24]|nr:putative membrane protein [Actinoalloteichus sp. GBA129-24]
MTGLALLGLCGLVLLGVTHARVGAVAMLVGAAAALLPVGPVIATILWVDRWEPEPPRLLRTAFLWGACGATITALLINDTAQVVGEALLGAGGGNVAAALVSAPLFEEAAKGLFVLGVFLRRRQEFDGIVDGIVYAGMTGVGFAFTENITYFGLAFVQGGFGDATSGVIAVFLLRGVLSPFTHPLFGAMFGIGLGIAAITTRRRLRAAAPLIGYLVGVLLHALWNGAAVLGGGRVFLDVYFLVMVPIFLSTIALVLWQRRREQRIVVAQLPGFAAEGWIAASEIGLLASLTGRKGWRAAVRRRSGEAAAKAVADYQAAVTELAFLRDQRARGRPVQAPAARLGHAVDHLLRTREAARRSPEALDVAARDAAGIRRLARPRRRVEYAVTRPIGDAARQHAASAASTPRMTDAPRVPVRPVEATWPGGTGPGAPSVPRSIPPQPAPQRSGVSVPQRSGASAPQRSGASAPQRSGASIPERSGTARTEVGGEPIATPAGQPDGDGTCVPTSTNSGPAALDRRTRPPEPRRPGFAALRPESVVSGVQRLDPAGPGLAEDTAPLADPLGTDPASTETAGATPAPRVPETAEPVDPAGARSAEA